MVRPLLMGQGADDPRVKQAEAEPFVAAIERNGGVGPNSVSSLPHAYHR